MLDTRAAAMYFFLLLIFALLKSGSSKVYDKSCGSPVSAEYQSSDCVVRKTYHPSHDELVWLDAINKVAGKRRDFPMTVDFKAGCNLLEKNRPLIEFWLEVWKKRNLSMTCNERLSVSSAFAGKGTKVDTKKLPYFLITDSCRPRWKKKVVIEPLVGFLRHPYHWCFGNMKTKRYVVSKDYLMPTLDVEIAPALGRGDKYLFFDLGCSVYSQRYYIEGKKEGMLEKGGASQDWFVDEYRKRGIDFDRIFAWEVEPQNPEELFAGYPDDVLSKLSYFNVGADPTPNAKHNPLTMLRRVAKKSDFVVLKIDIDTAWVEARLISQILEDDTLAELIDELYFEHHVHRTPMREWGLTMERGMANETKHFHRISHDAKYLKQRSGSFVVSDNDITASYMIFHSLRERGIRAHSWV